MEIGRAREEQGVTRVPLFAECEVFRRAKVKGKSAGRTLRGCETVLEDSISDAPFVKRQGWVR